MSRKSPEETVLRINQLVILLSKDEGITISELSEKTQIDRWTIKDMIDRLGSGAYGFSYVVEEFKRGDKRKTYYRIPKETISSVYLPGLSLTPEQSMLLSIMVEESKNTPILNTEAEGLWEKLRWINSTNYHIHNISAVEKKYMATAKDAVATILKAIEDNKCIEFDYKHPAESYNGKDYQVLPLYMYSFDGGLYFDAQKLSTGELRSYAVERIDGIPKVLNNIKAPQKIPYDGRLEDPFGPFRDHEPFELKVHFSSWQGWYAAQKCWPDKVSVQKLEDGTYLMTATAYYIYGTKKWILSQARDIIEIEPQWFKELVVKDLTTMNENLSRQKD